MNFPSQRVQLQLRHLLGGVVLTLSPKTTATPFDGRCARDHARALIDEATEELKSIHDDLAKYSGATCNRYYGVADKK